MIMKKLRDIWIAFGGDPSQDLGLFKRYSSMEKFEAALPNEEVIHTKEVHFVKMRPLKELLRNRVIEIIHTSDDGEFIRFKILPKGVEVGMWHPGDGVPYMVVDCETVHQNFVCAHPELYETYKG